MLTLRDIARALRGEVAGQQVLAPGPGHSGKDRSLSVRLSLGSKDGFLVHSHCGDDFRLCRDHVAAALGLASDRWRDAREPTAEEVRQRAEARRKAEGQEHREAARLQRRALAMWREAVHPAGTMVETIWFPSRRLDLPDEMADSVIRFHPNCPWGEGTAPAMVALIRSVHDGEPIGIHRTAFAPDGSKLGRKVFGAASAGAIMLDDFADVGTGLTVGEGIESCLAARQLGLAPVWSLIAAGNIGALPVLSGVQALTVLGEIDGGASARAARDVGRRWIAAGRSADVILPKHGRDMNDILLEGACP